MSEVFSINDLSLAEHFNHNSKIERLCDSAIKVNMYADTIVEIGHLELIKSKVEKYFGILNDAIDSRIHTLKTSKKFDLENMVKSLPVDVIKLIKEFMSDDVELVRKSFVLYNFAPFCKHTLYTKLEFVCKKLNKKKLIKLLDSTTNNYIRTSKRKDFYIGMIYDALTYFTENFYPNQPLQQSLKDLIPYSINKKYIMILLLKILTN